ncbi:MAG: hypothetical protein HRT88_15560 [Lentisphaeraceae bacterium]|nr:hypothetical protein [Lentisphaeraceae bacterium]
MKNKCNTCFNKIEKSSGRYNTPKGLFCILCYEEKEIPKYVLLARHAIHGQE